RPSRPTPVAPRSAAPPAPRPAPGPARVPDPPSGSAPVSTPALAPAPQLPAGAAPEIGDGIGGVLEELSKRRPSLAAQVESGARLRRDGQTLVLAVGAGQALVANGLQRDSNRRLLDEAVAAAWGSGAAWRLEILEEELPALARATAAPPPEVARVASHPAVQAVLEIFGGEVRAVAAPDAERRNR
ncbi:MAG: hypothetical protein KJ058_11025, partial [Thermoanaerobaculia bacterium]|nr:hypothetical protein [Thermoanaerobaculia bacterium]